jgi:glycosyltransferase involved in cell wall biosynthesis
MINQTHKSDDFIIIKDGSLTKELNDIISTYKSNHNEINIYELENNVGLGLALNYGIEKCKNELIARMDADDISLPGKM